MAIYQCTASERRDIHIQVEAENKKDAARKAMELFQKDGTLVLFESVGGMWTGHEDPEFDEEVEVTMALDKGPPYWDEPEWIRTED